MPTEHHFRRDHFGIPPLPDPWQLEVSGAVEDPVILDLDEIRLLRRRTVAAVLECAGHRRTELDPAVAGIPWSAGAVAEARWTGVSLADVLALAVPSPSADAVVLEGADRGPFEAVAGDVPFARALPLAKARHPDTLLAFRMNGRPLPAEHGAPLRAIVPGWYATDSVKWLVRIELIEGVFDGPFEALDYRLDGERLTELPVHALVTSPADGARVAAGPTEVRGAAWGGAGGIAAVEVRLDLGEWRQADLVPPRGAYGRTRWSAALELAPGAHRISARATDAEGRSQPEAPRWNPRGYANSSVHRVSVEAA